MGLRLLSEARRGRRRLTIRGPVLAVVARTLGGVSPEREALLRLVEEMPDQDVPAVLADLRRRLELVAHPESSWPPAWFGIAEGDGTAIGRRSRALLGDGFAR